MSGPPVPAAHTVRKRRRLKAEPKGLKAVPKAVWILLGVCLVIVLAMPIASVQGWRVKRLESGSLDNIAPAPSSSSSSTDTRQLIVSNTVNDSACSCIRGTLSNSSNWVFNEVQLFFQVWDQSGRDLGNIVCRPLLIKPHSELKFATDPVHGGIGKFKLVDKKAVQ